MKQPSIKGVDFGNVDIHTKGNVQIGQVDIGAVYLNMEDRNYIIDVMGYEIPHGEDPVINCEIAEDVSTFPIDPHAKGDICQQDASSKYIHYIHSAGSNYELTKDDLLGLNNGGKGTLYITASDEAESFEILAIQLWFTANDEYQYVTLEEEE
jgi:hypothetical protein